MMEKSVHIEFDFPQMLAHQIGLRSENASQEIRRILALFFMNMGKFRWEKPVK
jgi:hypothetical protein